ncbi:MAG: PQQ-dependent sugar dehydrogenase [Solirubrobacterales bacterium]
MIRAAGLIALLLGLLSAAGANAATLEPIGNFDQPIYVTSDPGDPNRLFVVEREGRVMQVQSGTVSVFADVREKVSCCASERGLLSIALAPDFDSSGLLYLYYTGTEEPGEIHVAELRAVGATAPISTLREVIAIEHPLANHNGGQVQFGPDGYLYLATGDGGGENDEQHNAQDMESLLGKMLRIDPRQSGPAPYTVPADNPFPAATSPFDTIWSSGLRNPFRFSFDRLSGDLTIGDVGQDTAEEVDYAPAPGLGAEANYGWSCREGFLAGPAGITSEVTEDPLCTGKEEGGFVNPAFDYPHADPGDGGAFGCAIIGGYVVRDQSLGSDLYGRYLYGDLCTGELRSLSLANPLPTDRTEGIVVEGLHSFGEDSCGRLYVVSGGSSVSRLVGASPNPCATDSSAGQKQLGRSYVGVKALSRRVRRGDRALITAWVSPCKGRRGEPVRLYRGRQRLGTRHLDRACTVRFRPRIKRRSSFRARVLADDSFEAAVSRRLKIQPRRVRSG